MRLTDAKSKNLVLTAPPVLTRELKPWEIYNDDDLKHDDNGNLYQNWCSRCAYYYDGLWVMVRPDAIIHDECEERILASMPKRKPSDPALGAQFWGECDRCGDTPTYFTMGGELCETCATGGNDHPIISADPKCNVGSIGVDE